MKSATATISSERLDLVGFTAAAMSALLAGDRAEAEAELGASIPADWPDAHDAGWLLPSAYVAGIVGVGMIEGRELPWRARAWLPAALAVMTTSLM